MEQLAKQREVWLAGEAKLKAWHAQTQEEALEPGLEIVDPHHHLWDYRQLMGFNLMGLFKQQYYMTDELVDDIVGAGHNVTRTVYVEAHAFHSKDGPDPALFAPLGEVQFAQGVAAQFASGAYGDDVRACAAIVGAADLAKHGAAIEPMLRECLARCPNFRGVRCSATHDPKLPDKFHPTPGLYLDATFREGFAALARLGLVFDAWCYASQLADVHDLARAFPETTIVLNHAGTPACVFGDVVGAEAYAGRRREIEAAWKTRMREIADECPNVFVKIGGFATPWLGAGFEAREKPPGSAEVAEVFGELYAWTIRAFGPERCMLESNFPVDKVSVSYGVLWNAHKIVTKREGFSENEREMLFSGTAKKVYRIE